MKLYNKYFASNYDELITYYPQFYLDVYEMREILKAHGRVADELEKNIEQTFLNAFAEYADAETLSKLEEFFHLTSDESDSLTSRRNMIKALLLGQRHAGRKEIEELISIFTKGEIEMELVGGEIRITVTRDFGEDFNLYNCNYILSRLIPAHLALDMVDKVRPVSVFNENYFVFTGLKLRLKLRNRSALVTGARLDGEKILNGVWQLNSTYIGNPFIDFCVRARIPENEALGSVTPQKLSISGFTIGNSFRVTSGTQIAVGAKQEGNFRQKANAVAGIGVTQSLGLSGSVTMDGRWYLDGDFILNGARRLNSIFIKEDL